jgi:cellulose synthase/poly-beta-1,6-N-acetylglucosamine synthase-like glycosyltransferase
MYIFYFFAVVVLWLGVLSLRGGFRFARYVEQESAKPLTQFTPFVSVIAPFRGLDQGLSENFSSLFNQSYPNYELIFVIDSLEDPALAVVEELGRRKLHDGPVQTRILCAGRATDSGQKVHNLRVAVEQLDARSEVLVFVDSDARPGPAWLKTLVAPLADSNVGAASGYRWFIPTNGSFAAHLRSVWNASITSALGADSTRNFCWGGSTAIRRSTFEDLKIAQRWKGTVSDDFTMTRALQQAHLPINFVPMCIVPSIETCNFREMLEFTNRQLKITRVYAPHLWRPLLIGSLLFCGVFFGGLVMLAIAALQGEFSWLLAALLMTIFILGAVKSFIRLRAITIPLQRYERELDRSILAHLFLWPLASFIYLMNATVAAFSRRIEWRGITYKLKSPTQAVIIRSSPHN